jgi:hypothetical protein
VTAIRDRRSDPDADDVPVPWDERPIVGARPGLPWWGAVLLAFGLALVGAIVDIQIGGSLGILFKGCYFVGSVGAVCAVQRRSLFGPMVQPPLALAVVVPGVVLTGSGVPPGSDTLAKALAIATPLINGFPTMAVTTAIALVVGIVRYYRERDPNAPVKAPPRRPGEARSRDSAKPRTGEPPNGRGASPRGGRPGERPGDRPADRRGGPPPRRGEAPAEPGGGPPPGRRPRPPEDGGRGGNPPPRRRPRPPEDGERRRSGEPPRSGGAPGGGGRPRRNPPRPDDPRAGRPRPPGRRSNPPRGKRPWDDED